MGATRFDITTTGDTSGARLLPVNVADVNYLSPAMSLASRRVTVYIEFYDAKGVPALWGLKVRQDLRALRG